jgi:hypothetical protein
MSGGFQATRNHPARGVSKSHWPEDFEAQEEAKEVN